MKKQILQQKSSAEVLGIQFNFLHTMMFGEVIATAAAVITVETGTDPNASTMLVGPPTHDAHSVTQVVRGGLVGVVYRLSYSARTQTNCVYVVEGLLAITESAAVTPP